MEVDDSHKKQKTKVHTRWYGLPSVKSFLAHVVDYPTTQATLRVAFHEYFADFDDLMCVLEIVEEWLGASTEKDLSLDVPETTVDERGVPTCKVTKTKKSSRSTSQPSLENVCVTFGYN